MDLNSVTVKKQEIDEAIRLIDLKRAIARYYVELSENANTVKDRRHYERKADAINMCHSAWIFNHYKKINAKDFQYVLHCHDKFCPVCQKLFSRSREMKYTSVLDKFAEDYDIYHGVLTSPNVLGPELRGAGGKYAKCFQKLLRYFDGRAKIKDLDLSVYGYAGALRALEIVPNIDRSGMRRLPSGRYVYFDGVRADYHIHYHVMLLLKPNLHLKHYIYNDFSESKKQDNQQFEDHSKLYYFSELEILIQNIWYLLINDQKVTKAAIDALPLGYSCRCSLISDGGYHQVFKYITKTQDAGTVIPLEVFETLETATRGKRALQGFGKFHGLGLEDDKLIEDCDPAFDKLLMLLNSLSGYEQISETPTEIRDNITGQKSFYISRKKYRGYFLDKEDFNEVDLSELLAPLPPELRETLLKVVEQLPAVLEQMPSEPKPTFKQLSFNLPESLKADTFNTSYLDGGRNIKPSKKGRKNG